MNTSSSAFIDPSRYFYYQLWKLIEVPGFSSTSPLEMFSQAKLAKDSFYSLSRRAFSNHVLPAVNYGLTRSATTHHMRFFIMEGIALELSSAAIGTFDNPGLSNEEFIHRMFELQSSSASTSSPYLLPVGGSMSMWTNLLPPSLHSRFSAAVNELRRGMGLEDYSSPVGAAMGTAQVPASALN